MKDKEVTIQYKCAGLWYQQQEADEFDLELKMKEKMCPELLLDKAEVDNF